jgi:hypothetical protein
MQEPPANYNICECCGTEFGVDDDLRSRAELRAIWMAGGAQWFFRNPPVNWNPWVQLMVANVNLPYPSSVHLSGNVQSVSVVIPDKIDAFAYAA